MAVSTEKSCQYTDNLDSPFSSK